MSREGLGEVLWWGTITTCWVRSGCTEHKSLEFLFIFSSSCAVPPPKSVKQNGDMSRQYEKQTTPRRHIIWCKMKVVIRWHCGDRCVDVQWKLSYINETRWQSTDTLLHCCISNYFFRHNLDILLYANFSCWCNYELPRCLRVLRRMIRTKMTTTMPKTTIPTHKPMYNTMFSFPRPSLLVTVKTKGKTFLQFWHRKGDFWHTVDLQCFINWTKARRFQHMSMHRNGLLTNEKPILYCIHTFSS